MCWIEDGKHTKKPCPSCGRTYIGKYNPKKLTIEAIEIVTLKIGDIIRNTDPYWGEPIKRIIDEDNSQYFVQQGPGKFGGWESAKYREIIFKDRGRNDFYRVAKWWERIWLVFLGWMIEKMTMKVN
jgi:hypothetical protein